MPISRETKIYKEYPYWIVALTNLSSLVVYVSGAFLLFILGAGWGLFYIFSTLSILKALC